MRVSGQRRELISFPMNNECLLQSKGGYGSHLPDNIRSKVRLKCPGQTTGQYARAQYRFTRAVKSETLRPHRSLLQFPLHAH